jgi:hypothetical protein
MNEWQRNRKQPSLGVRILLQVLRFVLVALFLYIAYLGIQWRIDHPPGAPQAPAPGAPPAAPGR